jgi:hypothetical protein
VNEKQNTATSAKIFVEGIVFTLAPDSLMQKVGDT